VGEAVANVGRAGQQAVVQLAELDQRRQAAQAGKDYAKLAQDIQVEADNRRANAVPGGEGHVKAVEGYSDKRIGEFLGSIRDPRVREEFEVNAAQFRSRIVANENGWEIGQRRDLAVSNAKESNRLLRNQLETNPDAGLLENYLKVTDSTVIGHKDISADLAQSLARDFKAGLARSFIDGMVERDPVAARNILKNGTLSPWLDPDTLRTLIDNSDAEIRVRESDLRRQQTLAETEFREEAGNFRKLVSAGDMPTDAQFQERVAKAEALGLSNLATDLRLDWSETSLRRDTKNWTPVDWSANINALEAKGDKRSTEENVRLATLKKFRPASESRFLNDPAAAAAAAGTPAPSVNLATGEGAAERRNWAVSYAKTAGLVDPPYLNNDEMRVFRERANQGPAGQLEVASELRRVWGVPAATSIIRQMGGEGKSDLTLMIGLHPRMAELYKKGADALKRNDKLFAHTDEDRERAQEIFSKYAAAIPPEMRTAVWNAARAITAGTADEFGATAVEDDDLERVFSQSIQRAGGRGGVVTDWNAPGGFAEWNGRYAWMPSSMNSNEFVRRLSRARPEDWTAAGVSQNGSDAAGAPYYLGADGKPVLLNAAQLKYFSQQQLETVAPGVYRPIGRNGGRYVTRDGRPWQFDIRRLGPSFDDQLAAHGYVRR
jgi:hypothetical protein